MKHNSVLLAFTVLFCCTAIEAAQIGDGKINVAVITLKNAAGVQPGEAELISDRLRVELFNTGRVNVMEREQMQDILKEQGFQASGACTEEACLVQMGQLLGVQKMITGSIGKLGSIFMLNLREIDVQTARISKAVSRDISGDIEKVVEILRDIAKELTDAAPDAVATKQEKPEVKKQEPSPGQPEEEKVGETKEPQSVPGGKIDKGIPERKKNRSGIRLAFQVYPGESTESIWFSGYDYEFDKPIDTTIILDYKEGGWSKLGSAPGNNLQLLFLIRIGQHVSLNLGMSYARKSMWRYYESHAVYSSLYNDYYDYASNVDKKVNEFDFTIEPCFVRRWYPFKLNVGLALGLGFSKHVEEMNEKWDYFQTSDVESDTTLAHEVGVGFSLAGRLGPEILAGPHVGFSADLFFKFARQVFPMERKDLEDGYGSYVDPIRYIDYPFVGLGLGVNFYF